MSEQIKKTAAKICDFLTIVEGKIEKSVAAKTALPATKLAKEMASSFGWEWPQAYHLINTYLDERPDLDTKKGPKGGIVKRELQQKKEGGGVDEAGGSE